MTEPVESVRVRRAMSTTRAIYKYPLELRGKQTLTLPRDAKILCVHEQNSGLCLWAEVVPERSHEKRAFLIFGTGHPIDPATEKRYIGTAFLPHGLVFHVFETDPAGAL